MFKKKQEQVQKERSNKRIRVNLSLDQDTEEKLRMLSTACDLPKTSLASEIVMMAVNHPDIIDYYQTKYCTNDKYRIIPLLHNEKITYS